MLRRLFYASASILMLALAYHLGVQSARAQGSSVAAAEIDFDKSYSLVIGRTLYGFRTDTGKESFVVPGTSPVVACSYFGQGSSEVLLENGDAWATVGGAWQYVGNVFATTPAAQPTWGQIKVTYRK